MKARFNIAITNPYLIKIKKAKSKLHKYLPITIYLQIRIDISSN